MVSKDEKIGQEDQKSMPETNKKDRKHVNILGTYVDSTPHDDVLKVIGAFFEKKTKFSLVTPNPEIILAANSDSNLQKALNSATLSVADGVGLKIASLGLHIVHGRKLFLDICQLLNQKGGKVYLLGGGLVAGTAQKALKVLSQRFTNVDFKAHDGPMYDPEAQPVSERDSRIESEVVSEINRFQPDMVFVALGCPKQEKWMVKWLPKLKVGGMMAVGGTLDYWAGSVRLPPAILEGLELEWLWRLLTQKGRFQRIFRAVFVFPLTYWFSKLSK